MTETYSPDLDPVGEHAAEALYLHHARLAIAYFELSSGNDAAILHYIHTTYPPRSSISRSLLGFTELLSHIYDNPEDPS